MKNAYFRHGIKQNQPHDPHSLPKINKIDKKTKKKVLVKDRLHIA
jgi:hypothetical protein